MTQLAHSRADGVIADGVLADRADAEVLVRRLCFRAGPAGLVGAELEWFTRVPDGGRAPLSALADALGPHCPVSLDSTSPARPLRGGGRVTVEPGGQVEVSSAPGDGPNALVGALQDDEAHLRALLAARGIGLVAGATESSRPALRLLRQPRYNAMARRFDDVGPFGRLMMCSTAATQVTVDAGANDADIAGRWAMLAAVGPALVAAFAASPSLAGAPAGVWASQRMRAWLALDPPRTRPVPFEQYASWALDVPLLCVRRDGGDWSPPPDATFADWIGGALDDAIGRGPDFSDLAYHLTTLFPPVRANGYLEVRYLDGQPEGMWHVPVAAVAALASDPETVAEASRIAADTAGMWTVAARDGLADHGLRTAAGDLLDLAAARSGHPDLARAARRCRAGRTPWEEIQ